MSCSVISGAPFKEPAAKIIWFSQLRRGLATHAMDDAEERTIRYYCIPPCR